MDYTAQRNIPPGASRVANKSGSAVAYTYSRGSRLCAVGFAGKARNAAFQYSFSTPARRAQYVTEFLRNVDAAAASRTFDYEARRRVFNYLDRCGFSPEWHLEYVIASVPGITLGTNGQPNTTSYTYEKVRSFEQAVRLVEACK